MGGGGGRYAQKIFTRELLCKMLILKLNRKLSDIKNAKRPFLRDLFLKLKRNLKILFNRLSRKLSFEESVFPKFEENKRKAQPLKNVPVKTYFNAWPNQKFFD